MTDLPTRVLAILEREPMTMNELIDELGMARTAIWTVLTQLELRGRVSREKLPGKARTLLYRAVPKRFPTFAKSGISREELAKEREASRQRCPVQVESGKCPRVRGEPIAGSWAGPFRLHGIFTEAA